MDSRIEAIRDLVIKTKKELDDIEWDNPSDPRIEYLVNQLNYYKQQEEKGEVFEPKF
mgnify:CR=1 FL=1|tara:strand:- start:756 stop:926 length:171 start_codon:yes stop_codon:yes gene_type:complete